MAICSGFAIPSKRILMSHKEVAKSTRFATWGYGAAGTGLASGYLSFADGFITRQTELDSQVQLPRSQPLMPATSEDRCRLGADSDRGFESAQLRIRSALSMDYGFQSSHSAVTIVLIPRTVNSIRSGSSSPAFSGQYP